ncbi:MAG: hypothetical protein JNK08_00435 [Sediminibacterium sp.]|nr:hypothetical protein [Sediminibacterium sp.]
MHIIDINGKKITITNLHAAIDKANIFIGYFVSDDRFRDFKESQKEYWRDILHKLQDLAKLN